jgi:hypothetical protein
VTEWYSPICIYCGSWLFRGPKIAFSGRVTCVECGYLNLFQSSTQPTHKLSSPPQPFWLLYRSLGKPFQRFLLTIRCVVLDLGTKFRLRLGNRNVRNEI